MKQRHVAALVAEALGVFALVLSVLSVSRLGYPFFTAIAAGVTITVMVSAFGTISGGHFNPAISISALAIRNI
ncbi:aquaporin, partial [Candidatus Saccharibacteria bacterium]|nr:aquaporin [Candidatus Saccharibacteria bacterium]